MTLSKDTSSQQQAQSTDKPLNGWRLKLYNIIFEAETPAGRRFDLALLVLILLSVAVVLPIVFKNCVTNMAISSSCWSGIPR